MSIAARTKTLLAPDPVVPQRDLLLDEDFMRERLAKNLGQNSHLQIESCEIARVKYRVGSNIRVLYEIGVGENSFFVSTRRLKEDRAGEAYEESLNKAISTYPLRPVFYDADLDAVFWTFPNDRALSNLEILMKPPSHLKEVLDRAWMSSRVAAYAPEKCVTIECSDGNGNVIAFAKMYSDEEGRRACQTYLALNKNLDENGVLRLPNVIYFSEADRILILEAIKGRQIAELKGEESANGYGKLGEAVALLHNAEPPDFLPAQKRLKCERVDNALRIIKMLRPDLAIRAEKFVEKLVNSYEHPNDPDVCLHGDLNPKNGIVTPDGLTLIDLDEARLGNAACDVGSLLALLHYKECIGRISGQEREKLSEAFLAGYEKYRGLPEKESVFWHTSAALFNERLFRSISRMRCEGLEHFAAVLARCERLMGA